VVNRSASISVLVAVTVLLLACPPSQHPDALVAPLMKLTHAIQAVVLYPEHGTPVPDDQLFETAVKDKPELRAAFQGLPVKIKHNERDVVVLVCSPDGKVGWLEDASWTVPVDKKWYETDPKHPPVFTLDPAMAPGRPAPR
jgi:hypothetical protein